MQFWKSKCNTIKYHYCGKLAVGWYKYCVDLNTMSIGILLCIEVFCLFFSGVVVSDGDSIYYHN